MGRNTEFKNFRKPVVYVLEQELRKRSLGNRITVDAGEQQYNGELAEYPVQFLRDSDKKIIKCIYGVADEQWSEELIRDSNGKVYQIKATYPNGSVETIQINKGSDNLVDTITEV
jgi:sirohydrochlorin ferrochelatase